MKKISTILLFFILAVFLMGGNAFAFALSLGTNITIWDKTGSGSDWHGIQEDQEVEPGCLTGQVWDLEGFFLNGSILYMVGGYNFVGGQGGFASGDIFFDVDGGGYDYVFDMNFGAKTYDLVSLNPGWTFETVYYSLNDESNPWRYLSGGTTISPGIIGFEYYCSGLTDEQVGGLLGGDHYAVGVVLPSEIPLDNFTAHFTYKCGNDNLMGKVPEPSTMLLLGFGLVGLAAVGRKRFH